MKNIILAITGASGAVYGLRLLQVFKRLDIKVHLIISHAAQKTIALETDFTIKEIKVMAFKAYDNGNIHESIASGSYDVNGMIVAPCSIKTLSAISNCYANNLINRAADVQLKERRKLILMVRETPYHLGHINLMKKATEMGAIILPPNVAMYIKPKTVEDIIDHTVGKALDLLDIKNELYKRWE